MGTMSLKLKRLERPIRTTRRTVRTTAGSIQMVTIPGLRFKLLGLVSKWKTKKQEHRRQSTSSPKIGIGMLY
jgi:hypothetical protein